VVADKFSGQSKGFGFVEMASAGDAATAIQRFNDVELKSRNIRVNEAVSRESSSGRGNRGGTGMNPGRNR
jgi:RNA recognition motif-containing protein